MDFDRLDAILKNRGISRRRLALDTGINEHTLATAFSRRSGLSTDDALRIARYLDIEILFLEGWTITDMTEEYTVYEKDGRLDIVLNTSLPSVKEMQADFIRLNNAGRSKVIEYIRDLAGNPKYALPGATEKGSGED